MEENTLSALKIAPGQYPQQVEIDNDLKALQQAVGGTIAAVYPFADPVAIICNDDGNRIFKRVACADGAAHRLLQGFQVVIDLDLLRILSRCNFQHRQSVLVLLHYLPPRI